MFTLKDFRNGLRVELHPVADAWMMGDRLGIIVRVGRKLSVHTHGSQPQSAASRACQHLRHRRRVWLLRTVTTEPLYACNINKVTAYQANRLLSQHGEG
jgi:hypothetical protein